MPTPAIPQSAPAQTTAAPVECSMSAEAQTVRETFEQNFDAKIASQNFISKAFNRVAGDITDKQAAIENRRRWGIYDSIAGALGTGLFFFRDKLPKAVAGYAPGDVFSSSLSIGTGFTKMKEAEMQAAITSRNTPLEDIQKRNRAYELTAAIGSVTAFPLMMGIAGGIPGGILLTAGYAGLRYLIARSATRQIEAIAINGKEKSLAASENWINSKIDRKLPLAAAWIERVWHYLQGARNTVTFATSILGIFHGDFLTPLGAAAGMYINFRQAHYSDRVSTALYGALDQTIEQHTMSNSTVDVRPFVTKDQAVKTGALAALGTGVGAWAANLKNKLTGVKDQAAQNIQAQRAQTAQRLDPKPELTATVATPAAATVAPAKEKRTQTRADRRPAQRRDSYRSRKRDNRDRGTYNSRNNQRRNNGSQQGQRGLRDSFNQGRQAAFDRVESGQAGYAQNLMDKTRWRIEMRRAGLDPNLSSAENLAKLEREKKLSKETLKLVGDQLHQELKEEQAELDRQITNQRKRSNSARMSPQPS